MPANLLFHAGLKIALQRGRRQEDTGYRVSYIRIGTGRLGMTNESGGRTPKFGWVGLGFVLTCLYVLGFAAILYAKGIPGLFAITEKPLELNTFGDFLAGFCAPLAFLWLFVATMVQSQELALQRQELRLTRREFEQNRGVAKEQAEEAKRSASFIGSQTKILLMHEADRHLDALIEHTINFMRSNLGNPISVRSVNGQSLTVVSPYRGQDQDDPIGSVFLNFQRAADGVRNALEKFPDRKAYGSKRAFTELERRLGEILAFSTEISPTKQALLAAVRLDRLVVDAAFLRDVCQGPLGAEKTVISDID